MSAARIWENRRCAAVTNWIGAVVICVASLLGAITCVEMRRYYLVERLPSATGAREQRELLCALFALPLRERTTRMVFSRWGQGYEQYDDCIHALLALATRNSLCEMDDVMLRELRNSIKKNPLLLSQFFWRFRWECRVSSLGVVPKSETDEGDIDTENGLFMDSVVGNLERYRSTSQGQRVMMLVLIASMLGDQHVIADMTMADVDTRFEEVLCRLRRDGAFYEYDSAKGCFTVNVTARRAGRPLSAASQQWPIPQTPWP